MKKQPLLLLLPFTLFGFTGIINNLLGALIPDIGSAFSINLTMISLLSSTLFLGYGLFAVPAGMLLERYRSKPLIITSLLLVIGSSLSLIFVPIYGVALITCFLLGASSSVLQVSGHPILRFAGGEKNYGFNLSIAQLVFGVASFLFPLLYSAFVANSRHPCILFLIRLTPSILSGETRLLWLLSFWLPILLSFFLLLIAVFSPLPYSAPGKEEKIESVSAILYLFRQKRAVIYYITVLLYVGMEVGVANWISKFLEVYHDINPQTIGAQSVSLFWALFTGGTALSLPLLKLFDHRKILFWSSLATGAALSLALFGGRHMALIMFPLTGIMMAPQWPLLFSLGINSVTKHHEAFAGLLSSGAVGGALIPAAIGSIGDWLGLRTGMTLLYVCLGFVLFISLWAQPAGQDKVIND